MGEPISCWGPCDADCELGSEHCMNLHLPAFKWLEHTPPCPMTPTTVTRLIASDVQMSTEEFESLQAFWGIRDEWLKQVDAPGIVEAFDRALEEDV